MTVQHKKRLRKAKRAVVVMTALWAVALIVFFCNPAWASGQLEQAWKWLAIAPVKKKAVKKIPCRDFETCAWKLNDGGAAYWEYSAATGITPLRWNRELEKTINSGLLKEVRATVAYLPDTMRFSFPYALPQTIAFMDTLANRFQYELTNTNLKGVRLVITSVLRTEQSVAQLMRHNRNAVRKSAHLHGTTFDVSYATYDFERPVTAAEAVYLRETLARVLTGLRDEGKCWVKYELFQTCFHVVAK